MHALPEAVLHVDVPFTHTTHTDAPAALPMYAGQAWHTVLPEKYENVPAAQSEQEEVPYEPGEHTIADEAGRNQRRMTADTESMVIISQQFEIHFI